MENNSVMRGSKVPLFRERKRAGVRATRVDTAPWPKFPPVPDKIQPGSAATAAESCAKSRQALELSKLRLALLDVRITPFLPFLGQIEEEGGVARELLQPRLPVAIGVERGLEAAQRNRAV